jgi:PAS domain S-box-containing protein
MKTRKAISKKTKESRTSAKTFRRLSQENAAMAEIGKVISSSLKMEEVYERFAEKLQKLIPFDRVVINTLNIEKGTVTNVYMAGKGTMGWNIGEIYPLEGSGNAEMVRTRSSLLIQTEDFNEYKERFPMLLSAFQAGFRSIMNVPLFSKGQLIGGFLLMSFKPHAYTDEDVSVAERASNQIACPIANAQLLIERERAEEALRKSEERYRTILEDMQEVYYEIDLSGNFIFLNKAFYDHLGYTKEEVIGKKSLQYQDETTARELRQAFNKIYRTGEPIKAIEGQWIGKDGTKKIRELSASLIRDSDGKPIGFRGISRDITERKRMEEALQESERALRASNEELRTANKELRETQEQLIRFEKLAAIGKLAGGVGHELRNPLGGIKNAAYYIKGKLINSELAKTQPRIMEFLDIIDDEISSSNKIIDDLLNFSRVGKPAVSPAEIRKVMEDALSHLAVPENVEVTNKLDANLPEVEIDAGQIRQVLANIATNAIQAMPEGGKLTIEARKDDKFLEVAISDTGNGIPEEVIGKIFDPLFTTRAKGIGLGLAVCKSIIERHEGAIEVESKVGEGAIFTVKLPLKAD